MKKEIVCEKCAAILREKYEKLGLNGNVCFAYGTLSLSIRDGEMKCESCQEGLTHTGKVICISRWDIGARREFWEFNIILEMEHVIL